LNVKIKKLKGFTLIEVVIATFIVGMSLIAVVGTIQSITQQTSRVKEAFLANLVAKNSMIELQLSPQWADTGEQSDEVEMAGIEWFKKIKVDETDVETLRRVEISVGINDEDQIPVSFLVGFISQSPQIATRSVQWIQANDNLNIPNEETRPGEPNQPIPDDVPNIPINPN